MDSGTASVDDRDMPTVDDERMLTGTGRHGPALTHSMVSVKKATVRCLKATIVETGK